MTIKFRAWNIQQKKFIEIAALDFHRVESACVQEVGTPPHFYPKTYPADENILMQFTGYTTNKSVDIYAGDILKVTDMYGTFIGFVEWWNDRWVLTYKGKIDGTPQHQSLMTVKNPDVIGDIHRNPELLKP